jgi:hypothetical protein
MPVAVAHSDNKEWSPYGAPWLQPVANGRKCSASRRGENKPKPLPWVATSCREERMVRRGSAVRVRQRASLYQAVSGGFDDLSERAWQVFWQVEGPRCCRSAEEHIGDLSQHRARDESDEKH